jgi:AcrR family transcriptional regulator
MVPETEHPVESAAGLHAAGEISSFRLRRVAPRATGRVTEAGAGPDRRAGPSSESGVAKGQAVQRAPRKTAALAVPKGRPAPRRTNDAERTRANILDVAYEEFAEKGFAGARIDEIADRTHTSKNMIYYYFESKEKLYRTVLEKCYGEIRRAESELHLEDMAPLDALRALVVFTFDYDTAHPNFVRMVMVENIAQGVHIREAQSLKTLNSGAIDVCREICRRGVKEGVIRKDITPVSLHMTISALCFFNFSNRYTFSAIHNVDLASPDALRKRRLAIIDIVLRYVRPD